MASEWRPIEADDPYNDESPVWVDENGCICWAGAAGEVQRLILHEDARLCHLVELPAAPAVPPDIAAAIGYCWRWAQTHAEKCIDSEERYQFMCGEIDKVVLWLDAQDTQGAG